MNRTNFCRLAFILLTILPLPHLAGHSTVTAAEAVRPNINKHLILQRPRPRLRVRQPQSRAMGLLRLGVRYGDAQRYEEAIEVYQQAIDLDPELAEAHYNLAWAYSQSRRYEEAIASCEQAIESSCQELWKKI